MELISWIIMLAALGWFAKFAFCKSYDSDYPNWWDLSGILSVVALIIILVVGFLVGGGARQEYYKAQSLVLNSEIVVSVEGLPIQTTANLMYLNKPLVIKKSIVSSIFGFDTAVDYKIELDKDQK